jgi:hypothetical protein
MRRLVVDILCETDSGLVVYGHLVIHTVFIYSHSIVARVSMRRLVVDILCETDSGLVVYGHLVIILYL